MKKARLLLSRGLMAVALILVMMVPAKAQSFVHPGIMHTQADLTRIKQMVAGGVSPWYGAYKLFAASNYSSSSYVASPEATVNSSSPFNIRYDATAAYQNALMWYITGNTAYATCSINIINAWATTLTSFNLGTNISAAVAARKFAAAGEILQNESGSGWNSTDTTNLTNLLVNYLYPSCQANITGSYSGTPGDGNQVMLSTSGVMAVAIYTNNSTMYNEAVNLYEGNSSSINSCASMSYYIDSNGCPGESGRDEAHSQLGVEAITATAQMAWCQGLNLWSYNSYRLLKGFEWLASYNLGNSATWSNHGTCYSTYTSLSTVDRGQWDLMYELAYNHFVVLEGQSAPYTSQVAALLRPENLATDQFGSGTLLFTLDASANASGTLDGRYKVTAQNSGLALDVIGGSTSPGQGIEQNTYTGATSQQWQLTPLNSSDEYYLATNVNSGMAFDAGNPNPTLGIYTRQEPWDSTEAKIWQISPSGTGYSSTSRATILDPLPITELVWDVYQDSSAPNQLIDMYTNDGTSNQTFTFTDLYPTVLASNYSSKSSSLGLETSSEGGQDLCTITNGTYAAYNSINTTGATSIDFRVSSLYTGGTIQVREGSTTGTLLGTVTVNYTTAWQTYGTVSCPISGATGTQNLYLMFSGPSGFLFNVLWFTLK